MMNQTSLIIGRVTLAGMMTNYFGQAMTGQGMKHVYHDIMQEAEKVYILKGADGFLLRDFIKKLGGKFIEENDNVDFFYEPLFEQSVEAMFVRSKKLLVLQGNNPAIEPILPGLRDIVIELYGCIDPNRIDGRRLQEISLGEEKIRKKLFETINKALLIHDDWEAETQKRMEWNGLNEQVDAFIKNLFSHIQLNKEGKVTHRLLGTLTPNGARDTVQSITKHVHRRIFIKGYPGTGKSTLMKKIANVALSRGFDVRYVWCGLDSRAIDMVIIPELSFCIFDSTMPHEYFPEKSRAWDEIFDMEQYCKLTELEEKNLERIIADYKNTMKKATSYAKKYADTIFQKRKIIDDAINEKEWETRTAQLFKII